MKKAFSLIELLISLITISVILASLAPVITHKMKHGGISIGTKKLSMACPNNVGSSCTLCLGNQCIACPITCGNQFKNTLTCKCESCTVANCANCSSGASGCDKCKAGYQKSGNSCVACGAGYYSTEGGTCQKCAKGTKANATNAATGCTNCDAANQYQDEEGKTDCKTCSGFVYNSHKSCTSCAAGTYWNGSSCQSCGAGSYSNSANVTSCSSCPSGQYQPNSGQTSCLPCSGAVNDTKTACRSCSDFGLTCIACNYYACTNTSCDSKSSCSSTQYFDGCHCQNCPSGQVQSADKLSCYTPRPSSCPEGQYLANNTCNNCPEGCVKCESATSCTECTNSTGDDPEYLLDGGKCKKYKKPTSQTDCDKFTGNSTIYIPDDYNNPNNGGFCMSKRNAGDYGGPKIDFGGFEFPEANKSTSKCSSIENAKCCWYGYSGRSDKKPVTTAKGDACTSSPGSMNKLSTVEKFDYESCKRTICNWPAADYICRNVDPTTKKYLWNLPSEAQLNSLKSAIEAGPTSKTDTSAKITIQKWSGANGLQLCQAAYAANTAGSPRCDNAYKCYHSWAQSLCLLHEIYGRDVNGRKYYGGLGDTYFTVSTTSHGPLSVRCVMHRYIED